MDDAVILPVEVVDYLLFQPTIDIARKTIAVDVLDLLAELSNHTVDRGLQRKWLHAIQSHAIPQAVSSATRSITTPTLLGPSNEAHSGSVSATGGAQGGGAFTITLRRSDILLLRERSIGEPVPTPTNESGVPVQPSLTSPKVSRCPLPPSTVEFNSYRQDTPNPAQTLASNDLGNSHDAKSEASEEVLFVLNPSRCYQSRTPMVRDRFHPSAQLQRDNKGWALYEAAEYILETDTRLGPSFDDSSIAFSKAAKEFLALDDFAMAGNCFVRAADCRRCVDDFDTQAELLVDSAEAYGSDDTSLKCKEAAVVALREAVRIYEIENRPMKAAKHARQAAEFAVEAGLLMDAITLLHYAANVYAQKLQMGSDAKSCLGRATAVCVMDAGNHMEAIACLEKMADLSTNEQEQAMSLFRAVVCRMACIPTTWGGEAVDAIHDCREVFSSYSDVCPPLLRGAECDCLESAITGLLHEDPDTVDSAFGKYVRSHTLEEWVEPLFWAIHAACLQRKSQKLRLYTL